MSVTHASYGILFGPHAPHILREQPQSSGFKRLATRFLFTQAAVVQGPTRSDLDLLSSQDPLPEHIVYPWATADERWIGKGDGCAPGGIL